MRGGMPAEIFRRHRDENFSCQRLFGLASNIARNSRNNVIVAWYIARDGLLTAYIKWLGGLLSEIRRGASRF